MEREWKCILHFFFAFFIAVVWIKAWVGEHLQMICCHLISNIITHSITTAMSVDIPWTTVWTMNYCVGRTIYPVPYFMPYYFYLLFLKYQYYLQYLYLFSLGNLYGEVPCKITNYHKRFANCSCLFLYLEIEIKMCFWTWFFFFLVSIEPPARLNVCTIWPYLLPQITKWMSLESERSYFSLEKIQQIFFLYVVLHVS